MIKKIIKIGLIVIGAALIIGGSVAFYLFNMPHRDVQAADVDYEITAASLVQEYLDNAKAANNKYLQEEGDSKILAISGTVASTRKNLKGNLVILLKEELSAAGVSCTFTKETNNHASIVRPGQQITVKGVIRSGAGYDEDLELYEDVIMEKCDLI